MLTTYGVLSYTRSLKFKLLLFVSINVFLYNPSLKFDWLFPISTGTWLYDNISNLALTLTI